MSSLQAQAEAQLDAMGLSADPSQIAVKPHRMTPHEVMTALQLYDAGEPFIAIGEKLGRDRETISKHLEPFIDSSELARKWLSGKALEMAQAWTGAAEKSASKGFHTAAKEALLYAKVIEPLEDTGSHNTKVNVLIGIPGAHAPLPSVQVTQDQ